MEMILTKEQVERVLAWFDAGFTSWLLDEGCDTVVARTDSGKIKVSTLRPVRQSDSDPLLKDCYSLREKFRDLEHFKRAYGL